VSGRRECFPNLIAFGFVIHRITYPLLKYIPLRVTFPFVQLTTVGKLQGVKSREGNVSLKISIFSWIYYINNDIKYIFTLKAAFIKAF